VGQTPRAPTIAPEPDRIASSRMVSRDGRTIFVGAASNDGDIWMIERRER
jgi:hypothetical protein